MLTIKRAGLEDLEQLAVLFDEYRQFYQQPSDFEGGKHFLQARLEKDESVVLMAKEDETAVGFTQLYPIFSSVGMGKAWLLNDLYVVEAARKQGVASRLLDAAKEYGRTTMAKWLMLETAHDNYSAQALYEKNGWKRVEEVFYHYSL